MKLVAACHLAAFSFAEPAPGARLVACEGLAETVGPDGTRGAQRLPGERVTAALDEETGRARTPRHAAWVCHAGRRMRSAARSGRSSPVAEMRWRVAARRALPHRR